MNDLRNTIAHILEHRQHLAKANEATIQQYVVLPILRALGWDDANLASMEVLPEYKVESRRADYTLQVKRKKKPIVVIECKRWSQSIEKYEGQICFYAYSKDIPLAIITNGKLWRFYLSGWKASSLSDRIFCETDIEDRENAISNLEKYLLKSNVASDEAELNAEIALDEKEKPDSIKSNPVVPKIDPSHEIIEPIKSKVPVAEEWTIERVRNSLSKEVRDYHEKYTQERCTLFYRGVADVLNLITKEEWGLDPIFRKVLCGFFLKNKGAMGLKRIFGIILPVHLPHGSSVDRNGTVIGGSLKSTPPRLFVRITEEEAKQLERQYGCEFCAVSKDKVDSIYYNIPENVSDLLSVLKFAYKKHGGN